MFLRQKLVIVLKESGRKFWRWELRHHGQRILPARRLFSRTTPTRRSVPGESPRPTASAGIAEPAATKLRWWHHTHPQMVSNESNFTGYSISEICGNVSFVFVCIAYLNTDILRLRLLSTGSIALSILFQYYRAMPLWIPIRWNALLLAINTVMTASLIAERRRADNMPKDLEEIYHNGLFETRGFNKVEFVRLFDKASQLTFKKGEKLATDGHSNRRLYVLETVKNCMVH
jgi:Popeye protein conserved region